MDLFNRIESIELKVKQLALKLQQVQLENASLRKHKEALEAALAEQKEEAQLGQQQLVQTQQKLKLKLEKEEVQSAEVKAAIDHYAKEINRCIEWLTNN